MSEVQGSATALTKVCSNPDCVHAGQLQVISNFHKDKQQSSGHKSRCKCCYKQYAQSERGKQAHKRAIKKYQQKPAAKEKYSKRQKKERRQDPLRFLLYKAKERAVKFGLEFTITKQDLPSKLPAICPVLGIPIKIADGSRNANSPTLDRIDNTKGYIPGNIKIISYKANSLKSDGSIEDFKRIIAYMENEAILRSF